MRTAEATAALSAGEVEGAFFVGGYNGTLIQTMLTDPDLALLAFSRAESYARHFPFLSRVVLTEGMVNLGTNIPAETIPLVSPVAMLVVRHDFYRGLKTLLVSKAVDIHRLGDAFSDAGDFPTLDYMDFPIALEAERYYNFVPFSDRYLPFWIADLIGG